MNITCKASRANRVILPALLMLSWKDPGVSFAGFISAAKAAAQALMRLQHAAAQAVMKPIAVEGGTNDEMRHKIGRTLRKRVAPFSRWRLRPCCSEPFFIPTTVRSSRAQSILAQRSSSLSRNVVLIGSRPCCESGSERRPSDPSSSAQHVKPTQDLEQCAVVLATDNDWLWDVRIRVGYFCATFSPW
eukprot:scaffold5892_cov169-Pinguiococcus_pyrenoidosus.AAC.2